MATCWRKFALDDFGDPEMRNNRDKILKQWECQSFANAIVPERKSMRNELQKRNERPPDERSER